MEQTKLLIAACSEKDFETTKVELEKLGVRNLFDMPLTGVRQNDPDLTAAFIADLVSQVLRYSSEMERARKHKRRMESIAAAKEKGIRLGRPPKERPEMFERLSEMWRNGEISAREAAGKLGISHPTFLAWVSEKVKKFYGE